MDSLLRVLEVWFDLFVVAFIVLGGLTVTIGIAVPTHMPASQAVSCAHGTEAAISSSTGVRAAHVPSG